MEEDKENEEDNDDDDDADDDEEEDVYDKHDMETPQSVSEDVNHNDRTDNDQCDCDNLVEDNHEMMIVMLSTRR